MLRQDTGYLSFEGNISFKVIAYHLESVHFFFFKSVKYMHVRSKSILYKQFYFKCIVIYQWPITDFWNLRIVIFCLFVEKPSLFCRLSSTMGSKRDKGNFSYFTILKTYGTRSLDKTYCYSITTWSTKLMTSFLWHLIPIQQNIKNFRAFNYARVGLIVQNFSFFKLQQNGDTLL